MLPTSVSSTKSRILVEKNVKFTLDEKDLLLDLPRFFVQILGATSANEHLNKMFNTIEYCHHKKYLSGSVSSTIHFRVYSSIKRKILSLFEKKISLLQYNFLSSDLSKVFQLVEGVLEGKLCFEKKKLIYGETTLDHIKRQWNIRNTQEMYDYTLLDSRRNSPNSLQFCFNDLQYADLTDADLDGCDFSGCDLRHADFRCAKMSSAVFAQSLLEGASMRLDQMQMALVTEGHFGTDELTVLTRVSESLSSIQLCAHIVRRLEKFDFEERAFVLNVLCRRLLELNTGTGNRSAFLELDQMIEKEAIELEAYCDVQKWKTGGNLL